jgi:hypothetical protein
MMSRLLFVLAVFTCVQARGQVTASLGTSVMFEAASSGRAFEQRQPVSVRGGYRFGKFDAFAEYSRLAVTTGTAYVGVTRKRDQLLGWARVSKRDWRIAPFAGVGAGFLSEQIDTRLGIDETSDSSGAQPVVAAAVGGLTPLSQWLEMSLEVRAESSRLYAPHPLVGLGLFLSAKF